MKKCFLIVSYCDTDLKVSALNKCIDKIGDQFDLCVYAHYPLPITVQKKIKYYIYDYSNPILSYPEKTMVFWRIYKKLKMSINLDDYGYTVLQMLKRGYSYLESLGYENIIFLNYDVYLEEQVVKKIDDALLNNEVALFYWDNGKLNPTIIGLTSNLNLNFITKENYISTHGDAEDFIENNFTKLKYHKFDYNDYKDDFYVMMSASNKEYKLNSFPDEVSDSSPWDLYNFEYSDITKCYKYQFHIGNYYGKVGILFFTITQPIKIKINDFSMNIDDEYFFYECDIGWDDFSIENVKIYIDDIKIENNIIESFINRHSKIENEDKDIKIDTLDSIAIKYGADKSSLNHNYCEKYQKYIPFKRDSSFNLLEIGVEYGNSIKMWREYYFNANIIGIDIDEKCKEIETDDIKIEIGSQSDDIFLNNIINKYKEFDLISDDGSHMPADAIFSFEKLFPFVKSGGIYIIEDVGVAYWNEYNGGLKKVGTVIEYFKDLIDEVNFLGIRDQTNWRNEQLLMKIKEEEKLDIRCDIESINFVNGMILIIKK